MLKVGDIVKCKDGVYKPLSGMKILKVSGDYVVVDNKTDIGDGVIEAEDLELDKRYLREKKLERILCIKK